VSEHANAALLTYRIGGHEYPVKTSARCKTCRSRHRRQVEALLVEGKPPTAIARSLPRGCSLSAANISEHFKRGHTAADTELGRRLLDEQSEAIGREVAADVEHALTERAIAQRVVRLVYERLASGELEITVSEALSAARILAKRDPIVVERDWLRTELDGRNASLLKVFGIVEDLVSDEQWSAFAGLVDADPEIEPFRFVFSRGRELSND
jgi:hypothetical protein